MSKPVKYVRQRYNNDCGVASLAMVAGIPYAKAMRMLHPNHKKGEPYSTTLIELSKALKILGFKNKAVYCDLSTLKQRAIVSVSNKGLFHAVAWTGSEIFDPAYKAHELDYYQDRLNWVLVIQD
jgi:ABC-type bacteriocin/lantibiotic exporter with double-glycine peptidase domain